MRSVGAFVVLPNVLVTFVTLVAFVAFVTGCPARRDLGESPPPPTASNALGGLKSLGGATLPPAASDSIAFFDAPTIAPLVVGTPLPRDATLDVGEPNGMEMTWILSPRDAPTPPLPVPSPGLPSANDGNWRDAWTILLGRGRAVVRFGARSPLSREGTELRFARDRGGALHVLDGGRYRIVPPGAARAFLDEGRADVLPLAASTLVDLEPGARLGRPTARVRVTTSYGAVELEQLVVEPRATPSSANANKLADAHVADASTSAADALDGAAGALCRFWLDFIASDRVLGGEPCNADRVPLHVEVSYVGGGGWVVDAGSLHEATLARDDLAFPPFDATLAPPMDDRDPRLLVPPAALLALRSKGDTVNLDLSNVADRPRVVLLDGLPVVRLPGKSAATIALRAASYRVEWRTPIGEIVESAFDAQTPTKLVVGQFPLPPATSPSAIDSVLKSP